MSYVPVFAPDAFADWRELSIEFQEIVLDELERLAANPPSRPLMVIRHHFEHMLAGVLHHLFIRIALNHSAATFTVIGVALDPEE